MDLGVITGGHRGGVATLEGLVELGDERGVGVHAAGCSSKFTAVSTSDAIANPTRAPHR